MKYSNKYFKKLKNAVPLEVSCGHCKTPILMYDKLGKGNLIKMQIHRIIESEIDLENHDEHIYCTNCGEKLARKGIYKGRLTFYIVRGHVNSKRLDNYSYK